MRNILAGFALAAWAMAAMAFEPPPVSVRKEILGALRPVVEKRLGPNVEFNVTLIRVQNDWAFVADPQRRGGKLIDGWRIFGEDFGNMDGLRVDAILKLQSGRWVVLDHSIGATDVWYCDVGPRSLKAGWGC